MSEQYTPGTVLTLTRGDFDRMKVTVIGKPGERVLPRAEAAAAYFEDCGVAPDENVRASEEYDAAFREYARIALVAALGEETK